MCLLAQDERNESLCVGHGLWLINGLKYHQRRAKHWSATAKVYISPIHVIYMYYQAKSNRTTILSTQSWSYCYGEKNIKSWPCSADRQTEDWALPGTLLTAIEFWLTHSTIMPTHGSIRRCTNFEPSTQEYDNTYYLVEHDKHTHTHTFDTYWPRATHREQWERARRKTHPLTSSSCCRLASSREA